MASYFSPNLSEVPSSGGNSDDGSWSTAHDQDAFEASIEKLRGSPASRPAHLFRRPVEDLEEVVEEIPSRFELVRRQQVPIEDRRKIPGCGINEFDPFDNPMSAVSDPIDPVFFQPAHKTYKRQQNRRPLHPPSYRFGAGGVPSGVQPQPSCSIPTYIARSPNASSPSSSSSSPPPAYEDFQPGLQSSFLCTPPHQQYQILGNEVERHPAYVPSYNVHPPENYYPSPSSSSPPSDQSAFDRTPEQSSGVVRVVRQIQRVFEDMFPTLSQEDGAPHETDYDEFDDDGGGHEHDAFESYYGGPNVCSFL